MALRLNDSSAFQSDVITIFVGPNKQRFTAHKNYLEKSDYFRACLDRGFVEGKTSEINLPEDDPAGFDVLLEVIYYDKLSSHITQGSMQDHGSWHHLFAAYFAADKYCIEELQNALVNVVAEACKSLVFVGGDVGIFAAPGLAESKMRKLLIQNLACDLTCQEDESFTSLVLAGGVDSVDILKATMALAMIPKRKNPASVEDICQLYHVHNKSKKCEKAKQ